MEFNTKRLTVPSRNNQHNQPSRHIWYFFLWNKSSICNRTTLSISFCDINIERRAENAICAIWKKGQLHGGLTWKKKFGLVCWICRVEQRIAHTCSCSLINCQNIFRCLDWASHIIRRYNDVFPRIFKQINVICF